MTSTYDILLAREWFCSTLASQLSIFLSSSSEQEQSWMAAMLQQRFLRNSQLHYWWQFDTNVVAKNVFVSFEIGWLELWWQSLFKACLIATNGLACDPIHTQKIQFKLTVIPGFSGKEVCSRIWRSQIRPSLALLVDQQGHKFVEHFSDCRFYITHSWNCILSNHGSPISQTTSQHHCHLSIF